MKKIVTVLVAGLALAASTFAKAPAFYDSSAYVIDTSESSGKMKDNVNITNVSSSAANFDINIFAYDEKMKFWIWFGQGHLKGLGDGDSVESLNKKLIKLENYRYLAIKTSVDNAFTYSFAKNKGDLNVMLFDDREIDESHFQLFDVSMLPKFSDNLLIVGGTLKKPASFKILVYNDENEEPKEAMVAVLKGAKDKRYFAVTPTGKKFNTFKYIKIISREEKDFKYTFNIEKNDLVVTVSE